MADIIKEESFLAKERRLKARKPVYKETYAKGMFLISKEELCEWIMQPDVLIRAHSSGTLNDETQFVQITVEGFLEKRHQK